MPYDAVVDKARLNGAMTATAEAIRSKTGSADAVTWDPDTGFRDEVDKISTGSASVMEKDVNFYDYDGTLLHSFAIGEAQALTELPPLPERDGLICQGWNWTLEEVNAIDRPALIGPNYDTTDGSTKLHIDTVIDNLPVTLNLTQSAANAVSVDWGDGSVPDTYGTSGDFSLTHEYVIGGKYVITLTSAEGTLQLGVNSSSATNTRVLCSPDVLLEANLGSNVSQVRGYSFYSLRTLEKVSFSAGVVFTNYYSTFESTGQLRFLALPRAATSTGTYFFRYAGSLFGVAAPPSFSFNTASFCDAYQLRFAPLPNAQGSVGNLYMRNARCLSRVYVPASLMTIEANAFSGCINVLLYDFTRHTAVPTLASTSAFTGINAACVFRVPAKLYSQWVAETNWATYAAQIEGG